MAVAVVNGIADIDAPQDILEEAKELFELCTEHEMRNRQEGMDDLRFTRLGEQWPIRIRQQRESEGRPVLTLNRLNTFVRQVVNDARQNKPAITVHPANDGADPMVAEIMSGLIRQIEYASDADVAYDTALASAVTSGWGYWRINTRYTHDDTFDQDICIDTVPNPFAVYGDPYSQCSDSSDWNTAFVVDLMPKREFKRRFKNNEEADWEVIDGYTGLQFPWIEEEQIKVAEYWKREETTKQIIALSNGTVMDLNEWSRNGIGLMAQTPGLQRVGRPRTVMSWDVTQYLMSGAEVLQTTPWAGKYIPLIPVYADEVNVGGLRYFRSMVRDVKDAQRMLNYWRTVTTELIALSPKAPYIGPKGAFESDLAKWETSNNETHAFMEFDGAVSPQRQPFAGPPSGAIQEALSAVDDMKAITGIYDASLGASGNETSGRAILLRQREGDTATFHYIDNLTRAIRHAGRILIDLIPKVYSTARIVRISGQDHASMQVPINQAINGPSPSPGMPGLQYFFDMTAGKYDLTVESGPSFTTKREEAANQMLELIRAFPQAAPVLGDLLAKNLDWPGADQIAQRLQALLPAVIQQMTGGQGGAQAPAPQGPQTPPNMPGQVVAAAHQSDQQISSLQQQLNLAQQQLAALKGQQDIEQQKADTADYKAQTERMKADHEISKPVLVGRT
jgi:hypothetical protein